MLDCASIREHNLYASQAALHGKKVKTKSYDELSTWDNLKKQKAHEEVDYDTISAEMAQIMQDIQK